MTILLVCVGFGLKTNNRAYSWDFYLGSFGFELVDRPTAKVTSWTIWLS